MERRNYLNRLEDTVSFKRYEKVNMASIW
jgi:hypothetical protein